MQQLKIEESSDGLLFAVKVVPGSSSTALSGVLDGMLKVKVSAPAEKGKANKILVDFLASKLGVKKSDISIISGQTKPAKRLKVSGLAAVKLREKLLKGV